MYVLYTGDYILAGPYLKEIENSIDYIKTAKLDITIGGNIQDFLGFSIDRKSDGTIHMTQPHLVDQILYDLKMGEDATPKPTPDDSSKLLSRHLNSKDIDNSFNYQSFIENINYMKKGSRSYIAYINHQCARFST